MQCCSLLFILKSFSKCLLMLILLFMLYFITRGTLFYHSTLIFLPFLLFLVMIFHFFNTEGKMFLFLLILLCPSRQGNWDNDKTWLYYSVNMETINIYEVSVVEVEGTNIWPCHVRTTSSLWFLNDS